MRSALPLLLIAACSAGCAHRAATATADASAEVPPPPETSLAWRDIARGDDARRIATLADRYAATAGATRAEVLRVGAGKGWPEPTPGVYDCRITRLASGKAAHTFRTFPCFVGDDKDFLTLTKSEGSERPGGRLWRDPEGRMIFLGGVPVEGQDAPSAYGEDAATDRIGILERIGDFRWRLIFDAPRPGVAFDVMELTPIAPAFLAAR